MFTLKEQIVGLCEWEQMKASSCGMVHAYSTARTGWPADWDLKEVWFMSEGEREPEIDIQEKHSIELQERHIERDKRQGFLLYVSLEGCFGFSKTRTRARSRTHCKITSLTWLENSLESCLRNRWRGLGENTLAFLVETFTTSTHPPPAQPDTDPDKLPEIDLFFSSYV